LKGTRVGGAVVSQKHANYIVNEGGATASDVLRLMEIMRERVEQAFGIELEPEVQLIGVQ
jgi:UDP-N-acetylmuramate dehydrogenase